MTTVPVEVWRRTSPLAAVYFLAGVFGRTTNLLQVGPVLGFIGLRYRENPELIVILPALALLAAVVAGLRYWFFRYRLEYDRILVRQGVVKRTALSLPFERVQGVKVKRSLIDRLFGLVTVSLDTAGSRETECRLPCVTVDVAEWLEAVVEGEELDDASAVQTESPLVENAGVSVLARRTLLKLGGRDIAQIGLSTAGPTVFGALVVGLMIVLAVEARRLADTVSSGETSVESSFGVAVTFIASSIVYIGMMVFLLPMNIVRAWLRFHDYALSAEGGTLRARSGLLTRRTVVVGLTKIQVLRLKQTLFLRGLRKAALELRPVTLDQTAATEVGWGEEVTVLGVPLVTESQAEELRAVTLGEEGPDLTLLPGDPRHRAVSAHYLWSFGFRSAVAVLVASAALHFVSELPPVLQALLGTDPGGLAFRAVPVLAVICGLGWLRWRNFGYFHDDDGMAIRRGTLGRKVDVFLFRKTQAVTVRQSFIQRWFGLATLRVQVASGDLSVPYIPMITARTLRNHMLWCAQTSRVRWH